MKSLCNKASRSDKIAGSVIWGNCSNNQSGNFFNSVGCIFSYPIFNNFNLLHTLHNIIYASSV